MSTIVFGEIKNNPANFNANIYLASDNTGSASDKDGKFIIQGVAKLPVQIKISHIGYKTVTYNIKKINSKIKLHLTGPLQSNKVKQALDQYGKTD